MDVTFWYDFGSPNAWFAHKLIPGLAQRTGATFTYTPVLLGGVFKATGNQAPMFANANIPAKLAYTAHEMQRFARHHGLTHFRLNPDFPLNTLALMRGAVAADSLGLLMPYTEAMFRFMWETPRKLDDPAILADTLAEAGLPADQLLTLAQDPAIKDSLARNTAEAVANGVFGLPSFKTGDQLFFGKDSLGDLETELRG